MTTNSPWPSSALAALLVFAAGGAASAQDARGRHAPPPRGAGGVTEAVAPPPIALEITMRPDSLRWAFALHNASSTSTQVPLDRRLLWLEVLPPMPTEAPTAHARRARPIRASRCIALDRPSSTEASPTATLAPDERRAEGFDVRDVCGLRLPAAFTAGATLTFHYGYPEARGGASFGHAVVFDGRSPPTRDLVAAPLVVPGTSASWPPAPSPAPLGDARVRLEVGGALRGADVTSIRVAARARQTGAYPMHTFFRPDQFRVLTWDPRGRSVECGIGPRGYAPIREFFVPLTSRQGPRASLALGEVCDPARFTMAGTYRAQVLYANTTDGQAFGMRTFLGRSASPYFYFQLTRPRRAGRYEPLAVEDPFAAAPAAP